MSKRIKDRHPKKRWVIATAIGLLLLAGLVFRLHDLANRPESLPTNAGNQGNVNEQGTARSDLDQQYRALIVGVWEDNYKGHRRLTVRKDGTATMVVKPESFAAMLYAKRMTFDEKWEIKDGYLQMEAVGGEPKSRVKLILDTMGTVSTQEILELSQNQMLLLDADGVTKFDWRRPQADPAAAE